MVSRTVADTPKWPVVKKRAEKTLPQPIHPHLVAYCPTMDLVAVVTQEEQLDVYRADGGQRAFGLARKGPQLVVDQICWKFNGHYLVVAWSDATMDIGSPDTRKFVRMFSPNMGPDQGLQQDQSFNRISCLSWGMNFIDVETAAARTSITSKKTAGQAGVSKTKGTEDWDFDAEKVSVDDILERQPDPNSLNIKSDLPNQLALVDVESLMPKLSALPDPPAETKKSFKDTYFEGFSSQISIDSVFHANFFKDDNAVDVLLRCYEHGSVYVTLYGTIMVGFVSPPQEWALDRSRGYLYQIASKATQLQNLLKYVNQTCGCIVAFWAHSQELPSRFMANINETLAEGQEPGLMQSLYHLAVTGNCPETIKEWLVNELTENGHKRWDERVSHGYMKVVDLTHENLLPALDRCCVVLATLRGLARYHDGGSVFNVSPEDITRMLDSLSSLRLLAHSILIIAGDERRQFAAFSRWLRHEIDVQATDQTSSSAEEMADRDAGVDYSQLLSYIQGPLTNTNLSSFLKASLSPEEQVQFLKHNTYEDVKTAVAQFKKKVPHNSALLSLAAVCSSLSVQVGSLFTKITTWQAGSSTMDCGIVIEEERTTSARDMRSTHEESAAVDELSTYVALVPTYSRSQIRVHRIVHSTLFDRRSALRSVEASTAQLPPEGEVKDVKFTEDCSIFVLYYINDTSYLLYIPRAHCFPESSTTAFSQPSQFSSIMLPGGSAMKLSDRLTVDLQQSEEIERRALQKFPHSEPFLPSRLAMSTRKGRKNIVIVAEGGRGYVVLAYE